jgi:hypothetical protein
LDAELAATLRNYAGAGSTGKPASR